MRQRVTGLRRWGPIVVGSLGVLIFLCNFVIDIVIGLLS